jgi:Leucine-rich repeat (LRR) protein
MAVSNRKKIIFISMFTLLCLMFTAWVYFKQRLDTQQKEVEWIELMGGNVKYANHRWVEKLPSSLRRIANKFTGKRLTEVNLSNTLVEDCSRLKRLPYLKVLDLSGTQIKTINEIAKLRGLEKLNLSYTSVDDLSSLSNLKKLKQLNLIFISSYKNLSVLRSLKNLGVLYILVCEKRTFMSLSHFKRQYRIVKLMY